MSPTLPPPPPLPSTPPANRTPPRAKSTPFDRFVALLAILTLAVVLLFLFPRKNEPYVIEGESTIELSDAPTEAPATEAAAPADTASAPSPTPAAPSPAETLPQLPVVGQTYEGLLTGTGNGKETRGLGKLKLFDCTVYVRGASKGETVRFRITEERTSSYGDRRSYFFAEVVP